MGITRIHIEEDAGKLLHDEANGTALDMNRCGVPLIEIVSEPDIRSAEEAVAYLRKLRAILTYTGVSDCRMNEGSMRCDVNLSVRRPGEPQSVERAIEAEYRRQVEALETGEGVVQETRRYDQKTGKTTSMRRKENSADYRYFPDPDLPEIYLSDAEMAEIRASIPALPDERRMRYMQQYGLTAYAAEQLTAERWLAEYFERAAGLAESPVALCNLILGEVFAQITLRDTAHTGERGPEALPIAPEHLAALSDMIGTGKVNSSTGKKILAALFDRDQDPVAYAQAHDLFTLTDPAALEAAARETLEKNPDMVKPICPAKPPWKRPSWARPWPSRAARPTRRPCAESCWSCWESRDKAAKRQVSRSFRKTCLFALRAAYALPSSCLTRRATPSPSRPKYFSR